MARLRCGFTLIELLTVIAIISLLVAILFPVFSSAKAQSKVAAALAQQKQIGTAIVLYASDYDDTYPRNDGCEINSSLNSKQNNGTPGTTDPQSKCQFFGSNFAWRMNHFAWQKWILPYTKSVDIFFHPARGKSDETDTLGKRQWSDHGQIASSFSINLALTGALNTAEIPAETNRVYRNSWVDGTEGNLPNPAAAALLLESSHPTSALTPLGVLNGRYGDETVTAYPGVWRELLVNDFYGKSGSDCDGAVPARDPIKLYRGGLVIGYADTHAKRLSANQLIAQTPRASELVPGWNPGQCVIATSIQRLGPTGNTTIDLKIDYPLWGLSK